MLSSFNVYAEGYYDTLGEQFYDNGEVVYENYSSAGVYSGPSEDVVFEIDETITIAGYPAIIYGANIDLFDRNNVRIAHFMDGEYFYDLMIIEDENYDPSHLDDLDYIVASFEKED
jgi:hypothetical protein